MKKEDLIEGKRYYFKDREYIYSGLYSGEINDNGNIVLYRRNGDKWAIPLENLYFTLKEARGR